jgi:uncharacterized protein (TIGR03067 family)
MSGIVIHLVDAVTHRSRRPLMHRIATALLLAIASASPAPAQEPAAVPIPEARRSAHEDLAKLQGVWTRIRMEVDGRSSAAPGGWTATYEGDRLTLASGGKYYRSGIVTLDPSRSPKAINTWDLDGPTRDITFAGIYEIEGDTLTVCFSRPGGPRPTKLEPDPIAGFIYFIYERQKP